MKPWVGYIRVSSVGEREGDSFRSPNDQRRDIERKATELGGSVDILVPDLNRKGHDPERETLLKAIHGVETGAYQGVIVSTLSRLSRRTRDTLDLWDRVRAAGGRVVAVEGNIDSAIETPESRLQLTILAAIDEHQHRLATERFARQRGSAVERGIWSTRRVPRGYLKDSETRRLIPDPEWAERVRRAFQSAAARQPLTDIAADLGMSRHGTRALLRNRVYLGELRDGSFLNPTAHPPLLSEEAFLAAQVWSPRKSRQGTTRTLLSGLVRCASCGHAMSGGTNGKGTHYLCHRHYSGCVCPAPAGISAHLLDPHVEEVALREFSKLRARVSGDKGHLEGLRSNLRRAQEELGAYLGSVSAADVGAESFAEGARIRHEAVTKAEGELGITLSQTLEAPEADLSKVWVDLSVERRTRALAGLIEGVVVTPAGRGRKLPPAERATIIARGAGVITRRPPGTAHGLNPIAVDDLDSKLVLGV